MHKKPLSIHDQKFAHLKKIFCVNPPFLAASNMLQGPKTRNDKLNTSLITSFLDPLFYSYFAVFSILLSNLDSLICSQLYFLLNSNLLVSYFVLCFLMEFLVKNSIALYYTSSSVFHLIGSPFLLCFV